MTLRLTRVEGIAFKFQLEDDVVRRENRIAVLVNLVPRRLRWPVYGAPTRPFSATVHGLWRGLIFTEITAWFSVATQEEYLGSFIIHASLSGLRIWEVLDVVSQKVLLRVGKNSREAVETEKISWRETKEICRVLGLSAPL